MTESYLTTDIVVIIGLIVALVLVGVFAFLIHYYWTKIGISEIWNTAKWSSIRSSVYRSMGRFNRRSTTKTPFGQPHKSQTTYKVDTNRLELPDPLESNASTPVKTPYIITTKHIYTKDSSPALEHNYPTSQSYATKIDRSIDNTKIYNIHEYDDTYSDSSTVVERQRF